MKVSNKTTMIQLEAYLKQARQQQTETESQAARQTLPQADKVDLSLRAVEANQMLREMPAVRAKEVRDVKAAVNNGTYRVDAPRVAGAMLRESFENDVILKKIDMHV